MTGLLKNIEIAFRRFLIKLLSRLVRARKPLPQGVDFAACKFLFVRQDRIGDVLVSTPLFHILKKRYPDAIVDVLLSVNNHFALANDPVVRRRWVYEKRLLPAMRLLKGIRGERYDFVIDLMDNPSATSTIICLLSGSRWNVGLEKENAYVYDIVVPLLSRKHTHIVDRIAQLLVPFGIDPSREDLHIRYALSEGSRQFARNVLNQCRMTPGRTVGINISAGHEVRFWGVDNFRALISLLQRSRPRRQILLLFKPSHRHLALQIADGFENVATSPNTESFDEFAALISLLGLLITPDTSAVHLAAAFKVPAVVMYVQSNKELRIWDPYGSPSVNLVADVDDLRVIAPNSVAQAASRLLSRQRPNTRRRPFSVHSRS